MPATRTRIRPHQPTRFVIRANSGLANAKATPIIKITKLQATRVYQIVAIPVYDPLAAPPTVKDDILHLEITLISETSSHGTVRGDSDDLSITITDSQGANPIQVTAPVDTDDSA